MIINEKKNTVRSILENLNEARTIDLGGGSTAYQYDGKYYIKKGDSKKEISSDQYQKLLSKDNKSVLSYNDTKAMKDASKNYKEGDVVEVSTRIGKPDKYKISYQSPIPSSSKDLEKLSFNAKSSIDDYILNGRRPDYIKTNNKGIEGDIRIAFNKINKKTKTASVDLYTYVGHKLDNLIATNPQARVTLDLKYDPKSGINDTELLKGLQELSRQASDIAKNGAAYRIY